MSIVENDTFGHKKRIVFDPNKRCGKLLRATVTRVNGSSVFLDLGNGVRGFCYDNYGKCKASETISVKIMNYDNVHRNYFCRLI